MKTLFSKAFVFTLLATAACGVDSEPGSSEEVVGEAQQELTSMPINNAARRTVVIVDDFVLRNFKLQRVFDQLVALSGTTARTPTDLYKQWWDTFATAADADFPGDPHCDDPGSNNSFPGNFCGRGEKDVRDTTPDSWTPIALFNRFDLAPKNGAHCGEYRIVYNNGLENFAIFEGILPNPTPECGIESCRPVVEAWESLATFDPATKGGQAGINAVLERIYFTGLKGGFEPVVHPDHYGAVASGTYASSGGQIRINSIQGGPWELREFNLVNTCSGKGKVAGPINPLKCRLQMRPVTVKNNPFPELFDEGTSESRGPAFRASFLDSIPSLAVDDINRISMNIDDAFNVGMSNSDGGISNDRYQDHLAGATFVSQIDNALLLAGSSLSPAEVVTRATTQSCAGCHNLSNSQNIGASNPSLPDLVWPNANRFTHARPGGFLSAALIDQFLPFRKELLDAFSASPPVSCDIIRLQPKNPDDANVTVAGKAATAAN